MRDGQHGCNGHLGRIRGAQPVARLQVIGSSPGAGRSNPYDVYTSRATPPNTLDNWSASGQILPVPVDNNGSATSISFLGAANDSDGATGQATVTYTDGNTQTVTIAFSDWTLNNATQQPLTSTRIAVTGRYRNNMGDGSQDTVPTHLYTTTDTPLRDNGKDLTTAGVQIASITLPNTSELHIFGISIN
jgi:hypothetical protein